MILYLLYIIIILLLYLIQNICEKINHYQNCNFFTLNKNLLIISIFLNIYFYYY